uniref:Uncharacterized protein n=1 Tax=Solanum tuberosum TaxID=4113 RepID=M1DZV3_SOLTU
MNIIETDDDWCVTKAIVLIAPDELERAVASLSIRETKKFVILRLEKAVALVPRETLDRPKFVIETTVTEGMTRSGSHSNGYEPIVDDVSQGCDFYTVELVNATSDELALHPHMPSLYKMIATVILRSSFEPGLELGKHFQGIVEPIQILAKGAKFGLGYVPVKNKSVDQESARPITHLYQSLPMREHGIDSGLGEGIWGIFEEVDAVMEDEAETSGIHDVEPEEQ